MGQSKQHFYRNGGSSGMNFLSPHAGTSSVPMNAKKTLDGKASGRSPLLSALPYAVGVFGLAFLASCITASIMTPVQNSDATTQVDIHSNQVAYFVNIATAGSTISKDVQATYTGTLGIIPDTLTVTSNTPDGYKVYLSMAHDDPAAFKQRLVNTTDSNYYFNPIQSGSLSSPANLSTANTWGVAVVSTYNSAFDAATSYTDATISQTTKFAPVPAYGEEQLLITRTGDTTTQDGNGTTDTIPVYYGYYANSGLISGTYSNTVMYTAYAEASNAANKQAVVAPSKVDSYKTPQQLSFTTTLYTSKLPTTSQVSVKINDLDCTNIQVSKAGSGNDTVIISCLAPAQTRPGNYDAVISIEDYGHVSYASIEYDAPGIVIASGAYAGTYKTMQSMTRDVCSAWTNGLDTEYPALWNSTLNAPNAFTGEEIPLDEISESETRPYGRDSWPGTVAKIINQKVPDAWLKDIRDNEWYRVRKLADGNCWMTENLRLQLSNTKTLTNSDTDLNTISSWTPEHDSMTPDNFTQWAYSSSTYPETDYSVYNSELLSTFDGEYQPIGSNYNWIALSAGGDTTTLSSTTEQANNSICPKNWTLPNRSDRSLNSLGVSTYRLIGVANYKQSNIEASRKAPLSMIGTAVIEPTTIYYPNLTYYSSVFIAYGILRHGTTDSINNYTAGGPDSWHFNPDGGFSPFHGQATRCVAK